MSIIWRNSALAHRHAEIGGELEDWNGMGTAWSYHSDPNDELTMRQSVPKRV